MAITVQVSYKSQSSHFSVEVTNLSSGDVELLVASVTPLDVLIVFPLSAPESGCELLLLLAKGVRLQLGGQQLLSQLLQGLLALLQL